MVEACTRSECTCRRVELVYVSKALVALDYDGVGLGWSYRQHRLVKGRGEVRTRVVRLGL